VNIKEIKEMINLMNDNSLVELEVEKDNMRIRLKKVVAQDASHSFNGPILIERGKIPETQKAKEQSKEAVETLIPKTVEIKAPMVGTFYRAPTPEAPPYVEVGQIIEAGQVICIIEAMKLMNEIKSEIKGKLLEVVADNAEPVEFGQPMFMVEPL